MDSVNLIVKGDTNYDGKFQAVFREPSGNTYSLYFNLEEWEDIDKHGIFGGSGFSIQDDNFPIQVKFDREVVLDRNVARAIYQSLFTHGWKEN